MAQTLDLKQLERGVYRETVQDGIVEILLGLLLVVCGPMAVNPKTAGGGG